MARAHLLETITNQAGVPLPNATVTVYEPGTTTPIAATMFAASTGGMTKSNPLTSALDGSIEFYLDVGQRVNLKIEAPGVTTRTIADWPVLDDPAEMMDLDRAQSATGVKTIPNAVLDAPAITGGTMSGTALSGVSIASPTLTGDTQVAGDLIASAMEHDATGILYTDNNANIAAWNPKLRVTELGSNGTLTYNYQHFRPHIAMNLTAPDNPVKTGLYMEIGNKASSRVDAGAGEMAGVTDPVTKRFQVVNGIIVFCNAQKDNGGDSSAITGIQWANGNAGSFIKTWGGRPAYWGTPNEAISLLYGYAVESGADLYSTVIDSAVYDNGIGHAVGVGATSGTGSSGVTEYGQGRVVYPYTSTVDLDTGLISAGLNLDKRLVDRVTAASAPGRYQHQYDTWKHTIDGKISQYSMFDDSTTTPGSPVYHRMVTQKTATDALTPGFQFGYRARMVGPGGGASASGAPNTEKVFAEIAGALRDAANNSAGDIVFGTRTASADAAMSKKMWLTNDGLLGVGVRPSAFTLEVLGAVGPGDDATRDLGSGAKRWRDIYASRDLVAATRIYTAGQVYTNGFTGANRTGMLQYTAAPGGETWAGMWYDNAVTALRIGAITQGTAYRDVHILTETGNVGKVLIGASGSSVGLYGTAGVGRQTVTGSRASGAALADLLTKLAATGIIINGSSA